MILGVVMAALVGDAELVGTLTGGLYDGRNTQEITRQATPAAFDEWGELLPCALVRAESQTPWGPLHDGSRLYFVVWLYAQSGYSALEAARDRIYALLHRQQLNTSEGIFEVRHGNDLTGLEAQDIPAAMEISRYYVTALRAR